MPGAEQQLPLLAFKHHVGDLYIDPKFLHFVNELGLGEFAIVERARWAVVTPAGNSFKPVVVKSYAPHVISTPEDFRELLLEARKLRQLRHPHISEFYGLGCFQAGSLAEVRASMFMVEEYVGTRTIRKLLSEQARMPARNLYTMASALAWGVQLAAALSYLHSSDPAYVHADVRADNAFLTDTGGSFMMPSAVKLGDLKPHRYVYDKLPSVLLEHRTAAAQQMQRSLAQFSQGGAADGAAAAADVEAAGAVGIEAVGGLDGTHGDTDEQGPDRVRSVSEAPTTAPPTVLRVSLSLPRDHKLPDSNGEAATGPEEASPFAQQPQPDGVRDAGHANGLQVQQEGQQEQQQQHAKQQHPQEPQQPQQDQQQQAMQQGQQGQHGRQQQQHQHQQHQQPDKQQPKQPPSAPVPIQLPDPTATTSGPFAAAQGDAATYPATPDTAPKPGMLRTESWESREDTAASEQAEAALTASASGQLSPFDLFADVHSLSPAGQATGVRTSLIYTMAPGSTVPCKAAPIAIPTAKTWTHSGPVSDPPGPLSYSAASMPVASCAAASAAPLGSPLSGLLPRRSCSLDGADGNFGGKVVLERQQHGSYTAFHALTAIDSIEEESGLSSCSASAMSGFSSRADSGLAGDASGCSGRSAPSASAAACEAGDHMNGDSAGTAGHGSAAMHPGVQGGGDTSNGSSRMSPTSNGLFHFSGSSTDSAVQQNGVLPSVPAAAAGAAGAAHAVPVPVGVYTAQQQPGTGSPHDSAHEEQGHLLHELHHQEEQPRQGQQGQLGVSTSGRELIGHSHHQHHKHQQHKQQQRQQQLAHQQDEPEDEESRSRAAMTRLAAAAAAEAAAAGQAGVYEDASIRGGDMQGRTDGSLRGGGSVRGALRPDGSVRGALKMDSSTRAGTKAADGGVRDGLKGDGIVEGLGHSDRSSQGKKVRFTVERPKELVHGRSWGLLYMAPELYRGERPTEKVDVYAFGVLLYELLSRRLLSSTLDPELEEGAALLVFAEAAAAGYRPPLPRHWPSPVTELVTSCWAAEPHERPRMQEVAEKLAAFGQDRALVRALDSFNLAVSEVYEPGCNCYCVIS